MSKKKKNRELYTKDNVTHNFNVLFNYNARLCFFLFHREDKIEIHSVKMSNQVDPIRHGLSFFQQNVSIRKNETK